ncbi:hypothetical protein [Erythrobacter rubeus]|uniref:Uncharacterized protein n=1 Tax=Erythrobacter rubeus TaxID=2760803 RepID=A0ABR8KN56_9SPHN|nr:hypothetical protein [Erythrobacter rubeus]MBD2840780.1 hypothetical protein [Erythrobacter rubeus]
MIYIAAISALALAIIWSLSPQGQVIHAARSKEMVFRKRRFLFDGFFRDAKGESIDLDDRMVGVARGESCVNYGISDGAVVIADKLTSESRQKIAADDLVIIASPLDDETKPMRFRKVSARSEGLVEFADDNNGALKPKAPEDIVGLVRYVRN